MKKDKFTYFGGETLEGKNFDQWWPTKCFKNKQPSNSKRTSSKPVAGVNS